MDGETERTQTPVKALRKMYGDKVEIHFVKGLEYSRDKNKMNFNKVLAKASQVDVIIALSVKKPSCQAKRIVWLI